VPFFVFMNSVLYEQSSLVSYWIEVSSLANCLIFRSFHSIVPNDLEFGSSFLLIR
jgi:hypothetical protein